MLSDDNFLLRYQIKFWRERIRPTINEALEIAPEDKLDWHPENGMLTLGNIFLHIAECSDWWFDEVMNRHKARELAAAPNDPSPPKAQIAGHLRDHWERLERFFASDPGVLSKTYSVIGRSKTFTPDGFWIFTHLLEHDIHHRSQINQYLRILGIIPPHI